MTFNCKKYLWRQCSLPKKKNKPRSKQIGSIKNSLATNRHLRKQLHRKLILIFSKAGNKTKCLKMSPSLRKNHLVILPHSSDD